RTILALACALLAGNPAWPADCPSGTCPIAGAPAARAPADSAVDARPIVRIENALGAARTFGTGTVVDVASDRSLIVTCAHLFREGTGQLSVRFADGATQAAKLLKVDAGADLAAIVIGPCAVSAVDVASSYPRPGDQIVSCGYGSDGSLRCNR